MQQSLMTLPITIRKFSKKFMITKGNCPGSMSGKIRCRWENGAVGKTKNMFSSWRNVRSSTFNTCERRNSPTNVIVLEIDLADRVLDVLGDLVELGRAGPTFLKQPVRISARR